MYKGIDSMSHCKDLMLQWGTGTGSTKTSIAAIAIAILIVSVVIHDVVIVISSTFGSTSVLVVLSIVMRCVLS